MLPEIETHTPLNGSKQRGHESILDKPKRSVWI